MIFITFSPSKLMMHLYLLLQATATFLLPTRDSCKSTRQKKKRTFYDIQTCKFPPSDNRRSYHVSFLSGGSSKIVKRDVNMKKMIVPQPPLSSCCCNLNNSPFIINTAIKFKMVSFYDSRKHLIIFSSHTIKNPYNFPVNYASLLLPA